MKGSGDHCLQALNNLLLTPPKMMMYATFMGKERSVKLMNDISVYIVCVLGIALNRYTHMCDEVCMIT